MESGVTFWQNIKHSMMLVSVIKLFVSNFTDTPIYLDFAYIYLLFADLSKNSFSIGRATTSEYCLKAPEIKQKLLLQMSKQHCHITRDLSDDSNPTYIEVSKLTAFQYILSSKI